MSLNDEIQILQKITKRELDVLHIVKKRKRVTTGRIKTELGISIQYAGSILKRLEKKGVVKNVGKMSGSSGPNYVFDETGYLRLLQQARREMAEAETMKKIIETAIQTRESIVEYFPSHLILDGLEGFTKLGTELVSTSTDEGHFHAIVSEQFYDVIPLECDCLLDFLATRLNNNVFMNCLTKNSEAYHLYTQKDKEAKRKTLLATPGFATDMLTYGVCQNMTILIETNKETNEILTTSIKHPELAQLMYHTMDSAWKDAMNNPINYPKKES